MSLRQMVKREMTGRCFSSTPPALINTSNWCCITIFIPSLARRFLSSLRMVISTISGVQHGRRSNSTRRYSCMRKTSRWRKRCRCNTTSSASVLLQNLSLSNPSIHNSQFTIHNSKFSILNSPFSTPPDIRPVQSVCTGRRRKRSFPAIRSFAWGTAERTFRAETWGNSSLRSNGSLNCRTTQKFIPDMGILPLSEQKNAVNRAFGLRKTRLLILFFKNILSNKKKAVPLHAFSAKRRS